MNSHKITIKTCVICCLVCVVVTATVFGSNELEKISAFINKGVHMIVNDEEQIILDESGNRVYPINYNGYTYVPIKALRDWVGLGVVWDETTNSVKITTDNIYDLLDGLDKKTDLSYVLGTDNEKTIYLNNQSIYYSNGIYCKNLDTSDMLLNKYINIPLNGEVNTISFTAYSNTSSSINIFNQQGKLLRTFYIKPNVLNALSITIDSEVTNEITFVGISQDISNTTNSYVKVLNIFGFYQKVDE